MIFAEVARGDLTSPTTARVALRRAALNDAMRRLRRWPCSHR